MISRRPFQPKRICDLAHFLHLHTQDFSYVKIATIHLFSICFHYFISFLHYPYVTFFFPPLFSNHYPGLFYILGSVRLTLVAHSLHYNLLKMMLQSKRITKNNCPRGSLKIMWFFCS